MVVEGMDNNLRLGGGGDWVENKKKQIKKRKKKGGFIVFAVFETSENGTKNAGPKKGSFYG